MSNVLIGIIGVVLFIGLALAGALLLGSDFQTATSDSRAAASVQVVQQAAQAVAMYNLKTGGQYPAGTLGPLAPRFLKSQPVNPIPDGYAVDSRDAGGNQSGPVYMTAFGMPMTSRNKDVCISAARATGMPMTNDSTVPVLSGMPTYQAGCYTMSAPFGGIGTGMYIVYALV